MPEIFFFSQHVHKVSKAQHVTDTILKNPFPWIKSKNQADKLPRITSGKNPQIYSFISWCLDTGVTLTQQSKPVDDMLTTYWLKRKNVNQLHSTEWPYLIQGTYQQQLIKYSWEVWSHNLKSRLKKVKLSLQLVVEAHSVLRHQCSHFLKKLAQRLQWGW